MADGFPSRSSTYCLRWVITHLPRRGFSWHLAGILHCRRGGRASASFGTRSGCPGSRTYVTLLHSPLAEHSELGLPSRILSVVFLYWKRGQAEHHRLRTCVPNRGRILLGLGIRYRRVQGIKYACRRIRCVAIQEWVCQLLLLLLLQVALLQLRRAGRGPDSVILCKGSSCQGKLRTEFQRNKSRTCCC